MVSELIAYQNDSSIPQNEVQEAPGAIFFFCSKLLIQLGIIPRPHIHKKFVTYLPIFFSRDGSAKVITCINFCENFKL